jgi:membrane protease YdiL (CAAX protease family)
VRRCDNREGSLAPALPGRRAALAALLLLVPVPTVGVAAAMFWLPGSTAGQAVFVAAKLWVLLLPAAWHVAVDRRRFGLSPPRAGGFGVAIASGAAISAVVVGAYLVAGDRGWIDPGLVARRAADTGLDDPATYLSGALWWITLNSLMEEYVWRWFVFRKFETLIGARPAVAAAAGAFTLHHVVALAGQFDWRITLVGTLGVFVGGVVWSALYLRYRSIWPGYVSHAIVDLPIFYIGYRLIFG